MSCEDARRYRAQRHDTAYVYDYPNLFRVALLERWQQYVAVHGGAVPQRLIEATELILNEGACIAWRWQWLVGVVWGVCQRVLL